MPASDQDPERGVFYMNGSPHRQDPQCSTTSNARASTARRTRSRSARGRITAAEHAGDVCKPTDLASCSSGICTSEVRNTVACGIGYGPPEACSTSHPGGLDRRADLHLRTAAR